MKPLLIIDTNFICAAYNLYDSLHKKADKAKELTEAYQPVVSNFILLETYTILSQRISRNFAISFGNRIRERHNYTVLLVDQELEKETWKIFCKIKDKNFSYVDASILALMQKEKIRHLLSFDDSFKGLQEKFNFKLIPE